MPASAATTTRGLEAVGLTADQRLVCFRPERPRLARDIAAVSGLQTDTKLVGIDYRPATGDLYGLGDQAGIYVVDPATAAASLWLGQRRAAGHVVRRRLQPGRRPAAGRERHRPESADQRRRRRDRHRHLAHQPAQPGDRRHRRRSRTNNDADPDTGTTLFDVDSA